VKSISLPKFYKKYFIRRSSICYLQYRIP